MHGIPLNFTSINCTKQKEKEEEEKEGRRRRRKGIWLKLGKIKSKWGKQTKKMTERL